MLPEILDYLIRLGLVFAGIIALMLILGRERDD